MAAPEDAPVERAGARIYSRAEPADGARAGISALIVIDPQGNRSRVPLEHLPFLIGRGADNDLVLRDNRVSRVHARVIWDSGVLTVEDAGSRNGVHVNGSRVQRHKLAHADRIEFGVDQSYQLVYTEEVNEVRRLAEKLSDVARPGAQDLSKLRALVEVARALQSSLPTAQVLTAVVDAALTITGSERGFLMLREGDGLVTRVARERDRGNIPPDDLRIPHEVIRRALADRRELLFMNFDPAELAGLNPDSTLAQLELCSVIALPLVRAGATREASRPWEGTLGLLYMDSRSSKADLASGNRELLETLALEASTILENARLLETEREKRQMDEELRTAREIQSSLLPCEFPSTGWFRACGESQPSHHVGGDVFDIRQTGPDSWAAFVADVSGKGVSSALLASLLEGVFLHSSDEQASIEHTLARINKFLLERTRGEKYATIFYSSMRRDGLLVWSNAGHCAPVVVRRDGRLEQLRAGSMPVGMLEVASYDSQSTHLAPGDNVVIFSDGVPEARNAAGDFFGGKRLMEVLRGQAGASCLEMKNAVTAELERFTAGAVQQDDLTLVVLEYQPVSADR